MELYAGAAFVLPSGLLVLFVPFLQMGKQR